MTPCFGLSWFIQSKSILLFLTSFLFKNHCPTRKSVLHTGNIPDIGTTYAEASKLQKRRWKQGTAIAAKQEARNKTTSDTKWVVLRRSRESNRSIKARTTPPARDSVCLSRGPLVPSTVFARQRICMLGKAGVTVTQNPDLTS